MINLLKGAKVYQAGYARIGEPEAFTDEELETFIQAEIVQGNFGLSVKLILITGKYVYYGLDSMSKSVSVGYIVDLKKAKKCLYRMGEKSTIKILVE